MRERKTERDRDSQREPSNIVQMNSSMAAHAGAMPAMTKKIWKREWHFIITILTIITYYSYLQLL